MGSQMSHSFLQGGAFGQSNQDDNKTGKDRY